MTSAEWLQEASAGTMLEAVRRHGRLPYRVVARKYRLTACAVFRWLAAKCDEPAMVTAVEACERYVDGGIGLSAVEAAIGELTKPTPVVLRDEDELGTLDPLSAAHHARHAARALAAPAPFSAAYDSAKAWGDFVGWRAPDRSTHLASLCPILRDIFGNPFGPVVLDPTWRTSTAVAIARQMDHSRDFSLMPILADALQDVGCDNPDILDHCLGSGPHVRGCWVVDLILGKS